MDSTIGDSELLKKLLSGWGNTQQGSMLNNTMGGQDTQFQTMEGALQKAQAMMGQQGSAAQEAPKARVVDQWANSSSPNDANAKAKSNATMILKLLAK